MDLNGISSYLKCPLCMELFENPKHLPCGHNICEKCLQCHIIRTVRIIGYDIVDFLEEETPDFRPTETCFKCPIDDQELTPPDPSQNARRWAGQFENNIKLLTLIEICEGKVRGVIEYCDNCIEMSQNVAAVSVCFTCVEKYCVKCSFIHRHIHSKDLLFNLSAIQSILLDNCNTANPSLETCKIHTYCQLSKFCLDCKDKCCAACLHTTHIGCKHVSQLDIVYEDFGANDSLERLVNRLKSVSSQIAMLLRKDLELLDKANSLTENGVKHQNFDCMLKELQCQISRWEWHHEQTQQSLKCLAEIKYETSKEKPCRWIQTEILCMEMEKAVKIYNKHATNKSNKLKKFKDVLDEDRKDNSKHNVKLRKPRNKNLTRMCNIKYEPLVKIKTDDKLVDISTKVRFVDKINMETDYDETGCWLTDCLFLTADFFIVADQANKCIKWKCKKGQVNTLSLKSSPQCLAAEEHGSTGCVTLPDERMIQFFCIKDECIDLAHQLRTKERCYGVDFIGKSWIAVSFQKCPELAVCILDDEGTEVRRISRWETIPYDKLFVDPRYLKVQSRGDEVKIFVTEFRRQSVTCLTLQGSDGHFSTKDISLYELFEIGTPLGIDTDEDGNLIVCSNSTGKVIQIMCTNENERQYRLLTHSLWLPRSVSFLKGGNRFMVTSDSGPCKNHVLVYEFTSKAC